MIRKINLFDVLLIALLICILIIANIFLSKNKDSPKENEDISNYSDVNLEYEILFETKNEFLCRELLKADEFYFCDTEDFGGTVKHITCSEHLDTVFNRKSGKLEKVNNLQYKDCYILICAKGKKALNGNYYIGTKLIKETSVINFKGKYFTTSGIIYKIKEV